MSMRQFLRRLKARWQLAVAAGLLTSIIMLATYSPALIPYTASVSFIIGQAPLENVVSDDEDRYFSWVTSEYIAIALRDWGDGSEFVDDIRWRLWLEGYRFERLELADRTDFRVESNIVTLDVAHVDEGITELLAQVSRDAFLAFDARALPHLERNQPEITLADEVILVQPGRTTVRKQIELPLRAASGIAAAFFVIVLAGSRRNQIANRTAVEAINLTVIGEIPEFS